MIKKLKYNTKDIKITTVQKRRCNHTVQIQPVTRSQYKLVAQQQSYFILFPNMEKDNFTEKKLKIMWLLDLGPISSYYFEFLSIIFEYF